MYMYAYMSLTVGLYIYVCARVIELAMSLVLNPHDGPSQTRVFIERKINVFIVFYLIVLLFHVDIGSLYNPLHA